jgi:type I restriction enzyme S subunit
MRKYNSYKNSKVEWIGEVPEVWDVKPLFTIANQNKNKNKNLQETTVLSLSYGKIIERDVDSNFGLLPESFETYQIVNNGFIILRLTDLQNDKKSLRVGLVKQKGIITSAYVGLFFNGLDSTYAYYLLHSYDIQKVFYNFGSGVRQNMTFADLKRLPIIQPSLEEQKQIAKFLDYKTNQIETLIGSKQKLIDLLQEERTAIINQAVTKGINQKTKLKPSGVEWLGDVPENWEVGKFNLLVKIRHGHQFMNYDFAEDGIKVIKITQLHKNGFLDISNCSCVSGNKLNEYKDIIIKENDILMCLTGGTIGKIIRVGKVTEPLLQNYRVGHFSSIDSNVMLDDFIFWTMSSESLVSQIFFQMRETGQPNIGMGDFGRMKITIPPIKEQEEIIKHIIKETARIDTIISKTEQEIELMKEYKTALIIEVVTGKVDVRDEVIPN